MFLTGTDEHGQKVQMAAKKAGISPKDFTDKVSKNFEYLAKKWGSPMIVLLEQPKPGIMNLVKKYGINLWIEEI